MSETVQCELFQYSAKGNTNRFHVARHPDGRYVFLPNHTQQSNLLREVNANPKNLHRLEGCYVTLKTSMFEVIDKDPHDYMNTSDPYQDTLDQSYHNYGGYSDEDPF